MWYFWCFLCEIMVSLWGTRIAVQGRSSYAKSEGRRNSFPQ